METFSNDPGMYALSQKFPDLFKLALTSIDYNNFIAVSFLSQTDLFYCSLTTTIDSSDFGIGL